MSVPPSHATPTAGQVRLNSAEEAVARGRLPGHVAQELICLGHMSLGGGRRVLQGLSAVKHTEYHASSLIKLYP